MNNYIKWKLHADFMVKYFFMGSCDVINNKKKVNIFA